MEHDANYQHVSLAHERHRLYSLYLILLILFVIAIQLRLLPRSLGYALPVLCLLPLAGHALNQWQRRRRVQTVVPASYLIAVLTTGVAAGLLGVMPATAAILLILIILLVHLRSAFYLLAGLTLALVVAYQVSLLTGRNSAVTSGTHIRNLFWLNLAAVSGLGLYALAEIYFQQMLTRIQHSQLEAARQQSARYLNMADKIARYAPAQVWQSIARGERDVKIDNKRKKLTVFFSDIQGFTQLSERLSPDDLAAMLNDYLEKMTEIAKRYGGTIDKFIGDALVIFYGDPETLGARQDALSCIAMAIAMRRQIKLLRQQWQAIGMDGLHVRMGVSSGYSHVGNFGSTTRMNYTIIGRDTNLAARLQAAAKPDQILISHDTYLLIRDQVHCQEVAVLELKGMDKPIQTWEVVDFHRNVGMSHQLKRWTEFDFDGFNLQMDMDEVKEHEREQILIALRNAEHNLMKQTPGNGHPQQLSEPDHYRQ